MTMANATSSVSDDRIVSSVDVGAALDQVTRLRGELRGLPLDRDLAMCARREVDGIQVELTKPRPDPRRAAARLERLTRVLVAVGALDAHAASLGPLIAELAAALGALGDPVRSLVGA